VDKWDAAKVRVTKTKAKRVEVVVARTQSGIEFYLVEVTPIEGSAIQDAEDTFGRTLRAATPSFHRRIGLCLPWLPTYIELRKRREDCYD
jgi:hypothetical protein